MARTFDIDHRKFTTMNSIDKGIKELNRNFKKNQNKRTYKLYLGILYNRKGMHREALEVLNSVSSLSFNFQVEIIKTYIYLNDYDSAIRSLDKLDEILSEQEKKNIADPSTRDFINKFTLLCLDRLGVLTSDYLTDPKYRKYNYYTQALLMYDNKNIIEKLEKRRISDMENNLITFREDIDIKLLVHEIEKNIENAKKALSPSIDDLYFFHFPDGNNYHDFSYSLIRVWTIRDTSKIISINLCDFSLGGDFINYVDFECLKGSKNNGYKQLIKEKKRMK